MNALQAQRNKSRAFILAGLSLLILPFQNCSPGFSTLDLSSSGSGGALGITASLSSKRAFGQTGLRRLTRSELSNSLQDVFGLAPASGQTDLLPEDLASTVPFDNEYQTQAISDFVVLGYDMFAEQYSAQVAADTSVVSRVAGCKPAKADDLACFTQFMKKAGRRILRRTITDTEVNTYAAALLPYAAQDSNFATAVQLLVQAWAMNPEFLYRVEAGETIRPEPGLIQLTQFEAASRMSYLIWGSTPDDTLLDAAAAGQLTSDTQRLAQAKRMLADSKAKRQFENFTAEWLGYSTTYLDPTLASDMRNESAALVDKVFDANHDVLDLFNSDQTYVTPALASHYGFPAITKAQWITGHGGGLLSHATVATLGAKFGDTSPTLRGYALFKRVMCQKTGPVPAGIDIDTPPGNPTDCKPVRYSMRNNQSCASCHAQFDGIGFGLENMGPAGEWRTTEPANPNCAISGQGQFIAQTPVNFNGPKELGAAFAKDDRVAGCATTQLFRFMSGRLEDADDQATLEALKMQYYQTPGLQDLILSLVRSPGMMNKIEVL